MDDDLWRSVAKDNAQLFRRAEHNLRKTLTTIQKYELCREWGYDTFDNYCESELNLSNAERKYLGVKS